MSKYLPSILTNFKKLPSLSSGALTSYNILTTLFNVSSDSNRLPIFQALLDLAAEHKLAELISPKFKDVPVWLKEWNASPGEAQIVYVKVAELCEAMGSSRKSTEFLVRAVESSSPEDDSKSVTIKAVNAALNESERLDMDDLLVLQPVKALEQSSPAHYQILNILSSGSFADLKSFNEANESFYSTNFVSSATLNHKARVLTVAALSARQDNRKVRYSDVASALELEDKDVETWIIEAIKSGLVEGKLSQPSATFLVHRATYRTFEHEQWEEISAKLLSWRESLQGILEVIDNVKNDINGGQQLTNGFAGSEAGDEEARSQRSDLDSVDENAD